LHRTGNESLKVKRNEINIKRGINMKVKFNNSTYAHVTGTNKRF